MSLTKSAPALTIEIRTSRYLHLFQLLSHCIAIGAVAFTVITPLLRAILIGFIVRSLYRNWYSIPAYPRVDWDSEGQWWLYDPDGGKHRADLLPGAYVHPWLVVLPLRVNLAVHRLVLVTDNVDVAQLRRLRVRLKQRN